MTGDSHFGSAEVPDRWRENPLVAGSAAALPWVRSMEMSEAIYLSDVGIEVNAAPPNRSPSTATFPKLLTVKSADPRRPAIAPNPGRSLNAMATFLFAAKGTVAVPIVTP